MGTGRDGTGSPAPPSPSRRREPGLRLAPQLSRRAATLPAPAPPARPPHQRSSDRSPVRRGAAVAAPPRPPPPATTRPEFSSEPAALGLRGAGPRPSSSASWRRRPHRYGGCEAARLIPAAPLPAGLGPPEGRDPATATTTARATAADAYVRTPPPPTAPCTYSPPAPSRRRLPGTSRHPRPPPRRL